MVVDAEKNKAKEKNSFRRKEGRVFKKSLTGPTLLEMSGCDSSGVSRQRHPKDMQARLATQWEISSSEKPLVRSFKLTGSVRDAFNLDARPSLQWHVPAKAHLKSGFVLP